MLPHPTPIPGPSPVVTITDEKHDSCLFENVMRLSSYSKTLTLGHGVLPCLEGFSSNLFCVFYCVVRRGFLFVSICC